MRLALLFLIPTTTTRLQRHGFPAIATWFPLSAWHFHKESKWRFVFVISKEISHLVNTDHRQYAISNKHCTSRPWSYRILSNVCPLCAPSGYNAVCTVIHGLGQLWWHDGPLVLALVSQRHAGYRHARRSVSRGRFCLIYNSFFTKLRKSNDDCEKALSSRGLIILRWHSSTRLCQATYLVLCWMCWLHVRPLRLQLKKLPHTGPCSGFQINQTDFFSFFAKHFYIPLWPRDHMPLFVAGIRHNQNSATFPILTMWLERRNIEAHTVSIYKPFKEIHIPTLLGILRGEAKWMWRKAHKRCLVVAIFCADKTVCTLQGG